MTSIYWFGPPKSKTLRLVVGVDCLRIAYDLRLVDYNIFHIRRSAWSESNNVLSCTPSLKVALDKVIWNLLEGLQEVVRATN
jgi:hypothetical protein